MYEMNMAEKVRLDVREYPPGHQFTVVRCEKCGVFYEPYGKEHKCKKVWKLDERNKEDGGGIQ